MDTQQQNADRKTILALLFLLHLMSENEHHRVTNKINHSDQLILSSRIERFLRRTTKSDDFIGQPTKSADFCITDRFLLADFTGRQNRPTLSIVWRRLKAEDNEPIAASFVSWLCTAVHSRTTASSSASLGPDELVRWWNILQALAVAAVADRTVSVRPCLNAAVLQDSYVAAVFPPVSL